MPLNLTEQRRRIKSYDMNDELSTEEQLQLLNIAEASKRVWEQRRRKSVAVWTKEFYEESDALKKLETRLEELLEDVELGDE